MMTPWTQILIAALTSSVFTASVLAALAYVGRSIIERWLARNLERYKAELQLAAFEYQTKFSKLHEKRAEVIAELYKRLLQIHDNLDCLSFDLIAEQDRCKWSEKAETTSKLLSAFLKYHEEHRIYFSENLNSKIDNLQSESGSVLAALCVADGLLDDAPHEGFLEKFDQEWTDAFVGLWHRFLPIRREVEREFRKMLGVDQTNDSAQ